MLHISTGEAAPPQTAVALWELHYADGQKEEIEIRQDEHVIDWIGETVPADGGTAIAWVGDNPSVAQRRKKIRICRSRLFNPQPTNFLEKVHLRSTMGSSGYGLLALTSER